MTDKENIIHMCKENKLKSYLLGLPNQSTVYPKNLNALGFPRWKWYKILKEEKIMSAKEAKILIDFFKCNIDDLV